jgi:hypothetical protein
MRFKCLINAVTGEVKYDQIHMSGNATNQASGLASELVASNISRNTQSTKMTGKLPGI